MSGKYLIVCGGTGGHLTPGIAIAQRLVERGFSSELIVSEKEIDRRLSSAYPNLRFVSAPGRAFSYQPLKLILFTKSLLSGFVFALKLIKREKPKAVIAFGGFTSVAFCLAARLCHTPIFLHEANRVPGRSIKVLCGLADLIFLPPGIRLPRVSLLKQKDCPLPLRREILHVKKDRIREELGISRQTKLLVVIGGSQGATALNNWVKKFHRLLMEDGISVWCVTGPAKDFGMENVTTTDSIGNQIETRYFSFHDQVSKLFSAADLVVTRAGAGTMAELVACLCPSIYIPYPYAADNHQLANARYLEMRGGGLLIEEKNLKSLYREVTEMIFNDWVLSKMRDNLRVIYPEDAATLLIDAIERYLDASIENSHAFRNPLSEVDHG